MHATLIEIVFNNLMALLPFVIVRSYAEGVRWKFGRDPVAVKPGLRLKIWFLHQIDIYALVDDVLDLPTQTVITKDGTAVCFSVNIGYKIVDVVCHACNVQDFVESTSGLAMTHLAQRVREQTYAELVGENGLKELEKSLQGTLTTRMKRWGTEVFSVGFTNFAKVRAPLRIFLDAHRNVHSLTSSA